MDQPISTIRGAAHAVGAFRGTAAVVLYAGTGTVGIS